MSQQSPAGGQNQVTFCPTSLTLTLTLEQKIEGRA